MPIKPNLPYERLRLCIVSEKETDVIRALEARSVRCIPMKAAPGFMSSIGSHPDIFFNYIGDSEIVAAANADPNVITELEKLGMTVIDAAPVQEGYPQEVKINAAMIGDRCVCKIEYLSTVLRSGCERKGARLVNVPQGYARCAISIVDENSAITSDKGIFSSLREEMNILLISPGGISLPGYNSGFIGGSSAKLSINELGFFGKIEEHVDYELIRGFCRSRGVEPVSLTEFPLKDIGGIIELM